MIGKESSVHPDDGSLDSVKAFVYMERLFQISGIYTSYKPGRCSSRCCIPLTVYQIVVFLMLLVNGVRSIYWCTEPGVGHPDIFRKINMSVLNTTAPLFYLLLVRAFRLVPPFVDKLNCVREPFSQDIIKLGKILYRSPAQVGKVLAVGNLVILVFETVWAFISCNVILVGDKAHIFLYPIPKYHPFARAYSNILTALSFHLMATWQCFMTLLCLVTFLLVRELKILNLRLMKFRAQSMEVYSELDSLEYLGQERLNFEHLLAAVDLADDMFTPMISCSLISVLLSFCFLVYNFVFYQAGAGTFDIMIDLTFLNMFVITVVVILINSLALHNAVSKI